MERPQIVVRVLIAPALIVLGILASACGGGGPEQQLLETYFQAARLNDNTTLGNIAVVGFDPRDEGIVRRFEVVNISEEQTRTLRVKDLAQAQSAAEAAADEASKKQKEYQDQNIEAIERVLKAERAGGTLRGRDAEVQQAWAKWREDMAAHAREVSEARTQLADERGVAEISVLNPRTPIDLTQYDGVLRSKDVTINATVVTPDQQTVERTMVVTLQRADLKAADGTEVAGRWVVTALREGPAGTS